MDAQYKIKTEHHPAERTVILLLNGKFSEDALADLERYISAAKGSDQHVYIDLSEVTLVDRKTVQYFSKQRNFQVKLVNCPIYLRRWITQPGEEGGN